MELAPDIDHIRKRHVTITKKEAYISNKLQLQNQSSTFIHKNKSLLPATRIPSRSPIAYNITAYLDKKVVPTMRTLANAKTYVDDFLGPKYHSNYLDVKPKVFKKDDNDFRLVQNLTMGEADFN